MTVAEIRFRFKNKDGIDKWVANYIEYLETILLKVNPDYYLDELQGKLKQNDYIRFLENKIVELTRSK